MGRLVQSNTTVGVTQQYTEYFQTKPWGGTVQSFTVPAGVSQIKLTAVAVGGCLAGAATTQGMDGTSNNVIFARMNGIDPPFVAFSQDSSTFLKIGYTGKYINGSITNITAAGVNGSSDVNAGTARMNGNYFNALDVKPWGIVVSSGSTTANVLSATTDGFNFTHSAITTTNLAKVWSCVFGGNGQAMVVLGTNVTVPGDNIFYTDDYGTTWKSLAGSITGAVASRIRYLNGYWLMACTDTFFRYTNSPVTNGVVNAWSTSATFTTGISDIAWTGSVGVVTYTNATNVQIFSWAAGAAPSGSPSLKAHGGDLAFDTCESSPYVGGATGSITGTALTFTGAPTTGAFAIGQPIYGTGVTAGTLITAGSGQSWTVSASQTVASTTISAGGEVVLFMRATATTSNASVRATSGLATTYNSVNIYAARVSEVLTYDAAKYMPFTAGGMWVFGGGYNVAPYAAHSTTSAVYPALTKIAITNYVTGNPINNASAMGNIQYIGSNYCSLGYNYSVTTGNGLGKYSAAGVIKASLSTAAQLTTEFGYTDTRYWAPSVTVTKNGVNVMTLQGGGTTNGIIASGIGGGGFGAGVGNGISGYGPTGGGAGIAYAQPSGNGGQSTVTSASGGGGTWQFQSAAYAPNPNSIVPGAVGAGATYSGSIGGGGGSLFCPAGTGGPIANQADPLSSYSRSTKVGLYGGGANGIQFSATPTYSPAAGGAQGCYQYAIACVPGDVFSLTLPGACYVFVNGSTLTHGGSGGESYAMIQYSA